MQFSDLHIHSKFSDGMLWPDEIVAIAKSKKINCISITDHDTIDSQFIIENCKDDEIIIIPGIELSTEYKECEIHILGYFIDIYNSKLINELANIKKSREERAKNIIKKLSELNINIPFEQIENQKYSIGRPHIAKILVEKGFSANAKEAFRQYLIKGKPAYVERYKINYKEALKLINSSGGIPVLAHPAEIYKGISVESIIREFKAYGLKGIEVFHPSHNVKETNDYYNLAKKYSLIITGGSDCHGIPINNNLLIGTVGIDENLTKKFLKVKHNKLGGCTK